MIPRPVSSNPPFPSIKLAHFLLSLGHVSCSFLLPAFFNSENGRILADKLARRAIRKAEKPQGSQRSFFKVKDKGTFTDLDSSSKSIQNTQEPYYARTKATVDKYCRGLDFSRTIYGVSFPAQSSTSRTRFAYASLSPFRCTFSTFAACFGKQKASAYGKSKPGKGSSQSPTKVSTGKGKPLHKKELQYPRKGPEEKENAFHKKKSAQPHVVHNDKKSNKKKSSNKKVQSPNSIPSPPLCPRATSRAAKGKISDFTVVNTPTEAAQKSRKKRPKWVEPGVSRTKVKARGRRARREERKMQKKSNAISSQQRNNEGADQVWGDIDLSRNPEETASSDMNTGETSNGSGYKGQSKQRVKGKRRRNMSSATVASANIEIERTRATTVRGVRFLSSSARMRDGKSTWPDRKDICSGSKRLETDVNDKAKQQNATTEPLLEAIEGSTATIKAEHQLNRGLMSELTHNRQALVFSEYSIPQNSESVNGEAIENVSAVEIRDNAKVEKPPFTDSQCAGTATESPSHVTHAANVDPTVVLEAEQLTTNGLAVAWKEKAQQRNGNEAENKGRQGISMSFFSRDEEDQALMKSMLEKYSKSQYPHNPSPKPAAGKHSLRTILTIKYPPTLLQRIYSSQQVPIRLRQESSFWIYLFKAWYLPSSICETLNEKPNENMASAMFSNSRAPRPVPAPDYQRHGATARDVLNIISSAAENGVSILVELGKEKEYSAIRWIVRRVLHPEADLTKEENLRASVGDVLGGFSHRFDETRKSKESKDVLVDTEHEAEKISVSRAGDPDLSHLIQDRWLKEGYKEREMDKIDPERLKIINLSREGYGMVLGSIGKMLAQSFEVSNFEYGGIRSKFWKRNDQISAETTIMEEYSSLLPIAKELLAYLHRMDLIPDKIYSITKYPRLSILRTRILTTLADAVWRHQELAAIEEVKAKGIAGNQYLGFPLPKSEWRLHGYWRGGFESVYEDYPGVVSIWDRKHTRQRTQGHNLRSPFDGLSLQGRYEKKMQLIEMMERGEREVLLEVVLSTCIEAGYGLVGTDILRMVARQGGWSWIKYENAWPEEYNSAERSLREANEATDGLPGRWGVRGYAVSPPPVRTVARALPSQILDSIGDAILNSAAEGQGTAGVISGLSILGWIFGKNITSRYIHRVVSLWEDEFGDDTRDPTIGEALLKFIEDHTEFEDQTPVLEGVIQAELRVWYKVLMNYITIENTAGAIRIWNKMEERLEVLYPRPDSSAQPNVKQKQYFHPPWVLGPFLSILVKNHQYIKVAYSLLSPLENRNGLSAIPENYLHLPPIAAPLLALAGLTKNEKLSDLVVSRLPLHIPRAVPHEVLTSMLSMYLNMGRMTQAQEALNYMHEQGYPLDGVDVGVLVHHALKRDSAEGYKFIQETFFQGNSQNKQQSDETGFVGNTILPNLRVRSRWGNWILPAFASASSFQSSGSTGDKNSLGDFVLFEGQLVHKRTASGYKHNYPPPKMSPSAWTTVLSHAIDEGDRENAKVALRALGVDIRSSTISTKIFNILLKGTVMREGATKGMEMFGAHCVPPNRAVDSAATLGSCRGKRRENTRKKGVWVRKSGKGREWEWKEGGKEAWGVRPDLVTVRTILDGAVRELERLKKEEFVAWRTIKRNQGWLVGLGLGGASSGDGDYEEDAVLDKMVEQLKNEQRSVHGAIGGEGGPTDGIYEILLRKEMRAEKAEWSREFQGLEKRKREISEVIRWCRGVLREMGGL